MEWLQVALFVMIAGEIAIVEIRMVECLLEIRRLLIEIATKK